MSQTWLNRIVVAVAIICTAVVLMLGLTDILRMVDIRMTNHAMQNQEK